MPAHNTITPDKLAHLIASPSALQILDLRKGSQDAIPASRFTSAEEAAGLARRSNGAVVVVDAHGGAGAAAASAILRGNGVAAEVLEGGFAAWKAEGLPAVLLTHLPVRHDDGRTWWVTRARPKVDRIACPWLIRRFLDPDARFLFVPPADVMAVAQQHQAEPFDIAGDGIVWSHRGDLCTFDVMVDLFGLGAYEPLTRLAAIVRGADTDRLDAAPEAAGLLAISLGLSRLHSDDYVQLEAGMAIYDALFRWCREAQGERHNWTSHRLPRSRVQA